MIVPPVPDFCEFWEVEVVGDSPELGRVRDYARLTAPSHAPVLITGETGTGKELVARSIHYGSPRAHGPFVPINCGAIPPEVFESQLFGHERGAFTDAKRDQPGLVAQADGGTLLLDEVDTLAPRSQVALLRFLQNSEYMRVGGQHVRRADVRVLATSNASLRQLVQANSFREDLLFRLAVLCLKIPPLRERKADIWQLAQHFVREFRATYQSDKRLAPGLRSVLLGHNWPGNVRELRNYLHSCFVLSAGRTVNHVPSPIAGPHLEANKEPSRPSLQEAKLQAVEICERSYLESVLMQTAGNISEAARLAGKERSAFGRLLKKHGIRREHFHSSPETPLPQANGRDF